MTLHDVLLWLAIVVPALACAIVSALLRTRVTADLRAALEAELAAGEPRCPAPPAAADPRSGRCEICGAAVSRRVSVSVQTDTAYQRIWLCGACMHDDHEYERRLARRQEDR